MSAANDWLRNLADGTLDRRAESLHPISERFGLVESDEIDAEIDENAADAADESADEQKTQHAPTRALDMGTQDTPRGEPIMPERLDPNQALRDAYRRIKSTWG